MGESAPASFPFWGKIDATTEWCEPNYAGSKFIAEFWNTLSSLPLLFFGLWGLYHTRKHASKEYRFVFAFLSLIVVGCGSVAFHATLRRYAQMMDEMPMLLADLIMLYCLIEMHPVRPRFPWLPHVLLLCSVLLCLAYVMLSWYICFVVMFISLLVAIGVWSVQICVATPDRLTRQLFTATAVLYIGGFMLWLLDKLFCDRVVDFYFHALWHLGAGLGTYCWIMFMVSLRGRSLRKGPLLETHTILPFVKYVEC